MFSLYERPLTSSARLYWNSGRYAPIDGDWQRLQTSNDRPCITLRRCADAGEDAVLRSSERSGPIRRLLHAGCGHGQPVLVPNEHPVYDRYRVYVLVSVSGYAVL